MLEIIGHLVAGNAYFVRIVRVVTNGAFAAGRGSDTQKRESYGQKNDGGQEKTVWTKTDHIHIGLQVWLSSEVF